MELTSVVALSFDCYGTLIDWDTGISAILLPWARHHGLDLSQRELLVAHAAAEGRAQRENPGDLYPDILARSFRGLGAAFGVPVTDAEAAGLGRLLHVAQSLYHDHVPAKQAGLPTVWINRHHDRPGWGAVPAPPVPVQPDWEFPSMEAFADAVESAWAIAENQGSAP